MEQPNALLAGYRRFRELRYEAEKARWRALAEGQSPSAIIIACSDSRADPATIFDTDPGEIFVVRNVANLVPPFEGDGVWLRCALHAHTTNSDGEPPPEMLVRHYDWAGYDVLAITDHWVRTVERSTRNLLVIPSIARRSRTARYCGSSPVFCCLARSLPA